MIRASVFVAVVRAGGAGDLWCGERRSSASGAARRVGYDDGVGVAKAKDRPRDLPELAFASPRNLPDPAGLKGRVVVLDIAFAADGMGTPFEEVTGKFLSGLGDRLAAWVDHHDHDLHVRYAGDPRFVLATKAQHGACPEMVTPELVHRTGPVDTILTHVDLDGLYAAAKWILGGNEPYDGADDDARAVDTRTGEVGKQAHLIDRALRARFRDDALKRRVVRWLVGGMTDSEHRKVIEEAAAVFDAMAGETRRLASRYRIDGRVAYVDAGTASGRYDKTELLLAGQKLAAVSIVRDSGMITVAAGFDSGWNFVTLCGLGGGMPTRVSLAEARLPEVVAAINGAPLPTPNPNPGAAPDAM